MKQMKFKTIFNIFAAVLFAVCLGMHFWNSYNGWGIATAKTLHPEVLAQLNDDDGGTTGGGGTTTGGDGDTTTPKDPDNKTFKGYEMKERDYTEYIMTDDRGSAIVNMSPRYDLLPNTKYTVTLRKITCEPSQDPLSGCDSSKEGTFLVSIIVGDKTAEPPTPPNGFQIKRNRAL